MSAVTAIRRPAVGYLEALLESQPQLPPSPLAWINALRAEAVDRLDVLTLPTMRDEEWRFTDISQLTKLSFSPALSASYLEAADIAHFCIEEATTRLVFVDGIYAPQLSGAASDSGVAVSNLQPTRCIRRCVRPADARQMRDSAVAHAARRVQFGCQRLDRSRERPDARADRQRVMLSIFITDYPFERTRC